MVPTKPERQCLCLVCREAGIVTARSGRPFTVFSGVDNSLTGVPNNDTADQLAPNSARPADANPLQQCGPPRVPVDRHSKERHAQRGAPLAEGRSEPRV